jgi:hypothetical protein
MPQLPQSVRKNIADRIKFADKNLPPYLDRSAIKVAIANEEIEKYETKQSRRTDSTWSDGPLQHFFIVTDDDPADAAPHYRGRYVGH